jgi:hypothetical protein
MASIVPQNDVPSQGTDGGKCSTCLPVCHPSWNPGERLTLQQLQKSSNEGCDRRFLLLTSIETCVPPSKVSDRGHVQRGLWRRGWYSVIWRPESGRLEENFSFELFTLPGEYSFLTLLLQRNY